MLSGSHLVTCMSSKNLLCMLWVRARLRLQKRAGSHPYLQRAKETILANDAQNACQCLVLSFVSLLVLTRGLDLIRNDMDDSSVPLIGMFGHCSHALTNLCRLGKAVTQRASEGIPRAGAFVCKGGMSSFLRAGAFACWALGLLGTALLFSRTTYTEKEHLLGVHSAMACVIFFTFTR